MGKHSQSAGFGKHNTRTFSSFNRFIKGNTERHRPAHSE
jgi:hypothetical protein